MALEEEEVALVIEVEEAEAVEGEAQAAGEVRGCSL